MAKIKITRGFYGLHEKTKDCIVLRTKGPNDDAFEVDDNEAKRLVNLGIAKYIGDMPVATVEESADEDNASVNTPETEAPAESEYEDDSVTDIPEYSSDSTVAELRAIAKDEGISFKVGMTKSEMIAVLDEHFGVMAAPDLSAETPVV